MWSRKFDKCTSCGSSERNHVAKGLCSRCYGIHIETKNNNYTKAQYGEAAKLLTKEKLYELYIGKEMSTADIGRLAGCSRINVYSKLERYGIKVRSKAEARILALDGGKIKTTRIDELGNRKEIIFKKIRYNKNFFKIWSDEMAYVLGLIFTDGNLFIRKSKSGYEIGILIFAQKEKELVEKFLKLMDCDATIHFKKSKKFENITAGELYYFAIGSNDLSNDLLKLGVIPNKSLTMTFPEIPQQYLNHFIRGFFDGDGSVYIEREQYARVQLLSGSRRFIEVLNGLLVKEGFSNRRIYGGTPSSPRAYFIRYTSSEEIYKFYNYMYSNVPETIHYSRKKKVFQKYFNSAKFLNKPVL
jgi:intein-encoded DNA endonuclease-like protein